MGWWHQLAVPRVPSGRFDYGLIMPCDYIVGDGNVLSALTNKDDVGNYTARIVADPRTLNRKVFAYTALYTQNQIYDLVEAMTGEHITRDYVRCFSPITLPFLTEDRSQKRDWRTYWRTQVNWMTSCCRSMSINILGAFEAITSHSMQSIWAI